MSIRERQPATERLELSRGDFLIVKKYLTAGETRATYRAGTKPITVAGGLPSLELDPLAAGTALVLAYLLDWSFQHADGTPIVIQDQPPSVVRAALEHIDAEAYGEVERAILQHQAEMAAALETEKKMANGSNEPGKISISAG